jgi:peptide/nickel transport system substrate-binding protein
MTIRIAAIASTAALAALAAAQPVAAQKSADTLRVAFADPISSLDITLNFNPEAQFFAAAVFDPLVTYDRASRTIKPVLAESWQRISDTVVEFKLRHGVKFHDGSDFTADDVVATLEGLADPKSKARWYRLDSWLDHVEKVDAYTVRLIEKGPTAYDVPYLSAVGIFPAALFGKLEDKADFGRKTPVGTGPYKVVSLDATKGIELVRNDAYASASPFHPAGRIVRVRSVPMADMQTQIAGIMTGTLDLIHNVPRDQAEQLGETGQFRVTYASTANYGYIMMDAAGRSGNAALAKPAVRKAIELAVDRESLRRNILPGGGNAQLIDALCDDWEIDCPDKIATTPPPPDLAAAKKLLAEAGYPDGFDLEITTYSYSRATAEAVGGELRKIGIRATIDQRTIASYMEKQTSGKVQMMVAEISSGGSPTTYPALRLLYMYPDRDYARDEGIRAMVNQATGELDIATRKGTYAKIYDRINAEAYLMPLMTIPASLIHGKDLDVGPGSINAFGADLARMSWK